MSNHKKLMGQIEGLSVSFSGIEILKNIDFELHKNQLHLLTGCSGSGKSTLLRSLNRLNECFEHSKTNGNIILNFQQGQQQVHLLKAQQLPELRRKVGMVFQHPQLLPGSIQDNILLPLKVVCNLSTEQAHQQLYLGAQQAQLWDEIKERLDQPAAALSGGQQQRLCLARVLAMEPEILLLDEPTASLDPKSVSKIEHCIQQLSKQYTILMVSHSMQQVEKLAQHHILLHQGKVVTKLP